MADPRAKFLITAGTDFAKANRETKTFFGSVQRTAGVAMRAFAAAGIAGAGGLLALAESAARSADELTANADKLGIATEKLAALQLAGRLTDVENQKLTLGLQRMTRRIAEAAQGAGEAQGALKELGLDAAELAKLTLDQQFQRVALAMQGVDNQSDKIRLGFKLFDSEGVDLIRTLGVMGENFAEIEEEAVRFGVAISRVDAAKIDAANDAVVRAQTAWQGIGTNIALAIAPIKENLANAFADAVRESNGFKSQIEGAMRAVVAAANFAANAIIGIELALIQVKIAALRLQQLRTEEGVVGTALRILSSPPAIGPGGVAIAAKARRDRENRKSDLNRILDELDAAIEKSRELAGNMRTAEEALAAYDQMVAEATARAQEAAAAATTGGVPGIGTGVDAEAEELAKERREKEIEELQLLLREKLRLEEQAAQERVRIEQQAEEAIRAQRMQTVDLALGLLQALGAKNKAFAIAAIVLEKALAIQRVLLANRVAAELAFASQLIPGDPTSLARAAAAKAAVLTQGKIAAALIAATGLVQIATLGEGSTGAPLGTPTNPVFTDSEREREPQRAERVVTINLYGDVLTEDRLERVLTGMFDADRVIIHGNTAQAAVMRRGG